METYELRYFLKVAETENIHKSAEGLNISPSAISKAISRLEEELEVKLFEKVGRNIKITNHGNKLVKDAKELIALRKNIIESYNLNRDTLNLKIVGPELPLSEWGPRIISKIKKKYKKAEVTLEVTTNKEAISLVNSYAADLAIFCSTRNVPGKMYKKLEEVPFRTYVSEKHHLSKRRGGIPVEEVLGEAFFMTEPSFLGEFSNHHSLDGWRDDKLSRKNKQFTRSIKCLESFLKSGLAVSYLPEYYGRSLGLKPLKIINCPYHCEQKILLARNKYSLEPVWDSL